MSTLLTEDELDLALRNVPRWKYDLPGKRIVREVKCQAFMDGIDIVRDIAELAEEAQHHPDIDIRWTTITFALSTHSAGGLTKKDFALAREIDALVN
ncbi:MAG: 4a-hydroxytetrahydrobiopterin dehydratase [Verrucomicrobiales bacterium]|jgi:4a-hydroxytetrahydrobiopterin dehydratase